MGWRSSDRDPNSVLDEHQIIKSSLAGIAANELWICNTYVGSTCDINFPGVSMMNRSVFLSLVAGLLASLAFAAPSQAATSCLSLRYFCGIQAERCRIYRDRLLGTYQQLCRWGQTISLRLHGNLFSGNLLNRIFHSGGLPALLTWFVQGAGVGLTGSFLLPPA